MRPLSLPRRTHRRSAVTAAPGGTSTVTANSGLASIRRRRRTSTSNSLTSPRRRTHPTTSTAKPPTYWEWRESADVQRLERAANLWTAAFLWSHDAGFAPTSREYWRALAGEEVAQHEQTTRLADETSVLPLGAAVPGDPCARRLRLRDRQPAVGAVREPGEGMVRLAGARRRRPARGIA